MILTVGPASEAIAAQSLALSTGWLGVEPPVQIVPVGPESADVVARACIALASPELASRLQAHGLSLGDSADLQVWLIVDATADAAGPGASPCRVALAAMHSVEQMAWRQLRLHVIPCLLVLGEPERAEGAAEWIACLRDVGADNCFVAGPVDAMHLRLDDAEWHARAATGLSALLWGRPENSAGDDAESCRALGGAAWTPPAPAAKRWLTHHRAQEAVRRLAEGRNWGDAPGDASEVSAPPWCADDLWISPERHREELATRVPMPLLDQTWRERRPNWPSLSTLASAICADAEDALGPQRDREYTLRQCWVAEQVGNWEFRLAEMREEGLSPAQLAAMVRRQRAALQQALIRIEDWLEAAVHAHMRADELVTRSQEDLRQVCAGFPAATFEAALSAVARPWLWPDWAWDYMVRLPRAGKRLLDALRRQAQARWAAANLHALRQAHLAMAQAANASLGEAERLAALLVQIRDVLDRGAPTDKDLAELAPWTSERLAQLAERNPPETWPGLGRVGDATAEAAAEDLLAWATVTFGWLDSWTAADYLRMALPDDELTEWIRRFVTGPAPLWPGGERGDETSWLLAPPGASALMPAVADVAGNGRSLAVRLGQSPTDVVLALRLLQVRITQDASLVRAVEEENR
jgi:hypothetical protein